jgi:hypothetical protein
VPEVDVLPELLGDLFGGERRWRLPVLRAHREHHGCRVPVAEGDAAPDVLAVPFERDAALEVCGRARGPERGRAVRQVEVVGGPGVVEPRPAFESEVHGAAHGADDAHQLVLVGRRRARQDRHVVDDLADSVG